MKLIGITGKARSGKDTIAKYLWEKHEFTRIAIADPLKFAARAIFGLSHEQVFDDSLKGEVIPYWGMSPRQLFQQLGTEAVKGTFGEDTWVRRWLMSYYVISKTDHVVVPDVRFDIEAETIRTLGGIIIEVRRGPGLVGSTGDHVSEHGLSTLPDAVISNDGTLEDLHAVVDALVRTME
jgi:hypothetical protein